MSDVTEQFFDDLGQRGHVPVLASVTGEVRFDVVDSKRTRHWLVTIARGDITVSHGTGKGDCAVRADVELFDRLARGDDNAMAATLRGALLCVGDVDLLLAIHKLFPGPTSHRAVRGAG